MKKTALILALGLIGSVAYTAHAFTLKTPLLSNPDVKTLVADRQHVNTPEAELIINGSRKLYETGLYRVLDPVTGYVIYIYRPNDTSVPSSIEAVPLKRN